MAFNLLFKKKKNPPNISPTPFLVRRPGAYAYAPYAPSPTPMHLTIVCRSKDDLIETLNDISHLGCVFSGMGFGLLLAIWSITRNTPYPPQAGKICPQPLFFLFYLSSKIMSRFVSGQQPVEIDYKNLLTSFQGQMDGPFWKNRNCLIYHLVILKLILIAFCFNPSPKL